MSGNTPGSFSSPQERHMVLFQISKYTALPSSTMKPSYTIGCANNCGASTFASSYM
jgi:hypothetical protein